MSGTQSVLDQMTAGIMDKKAAKATTLTPVSGEKAVLDRTFPVALPYDNADMIQKALADAREQVVFVLEGIDKIISAFGENPYQSAAPDTADLAQRQKEREADERVKAAACPKYEQLQQEAQASLGWDQPTPPVQSPTERGGWFCHTHKDAPVRELTSKKGRVYKACTICEEFER